MHKPKCYRILIVMLWLVAVLSGIALTMFVLKSSMRIEIPCNISSIINVNYTCTGMYGRGPEWCTNHTTPGYQVHVWYEDDIIPVCADQKICNCCDNKGCRIVIDFDMNCVPLDQLPKRCFVENNKAFIQEYPINYAGLIFWSIFGYSLCCVCCCIALS